MLWQSTPIQLDDGRKADVTVTDQHMVVLSAYDKAHTLMVELKGASDEMRAIACALIEGADMADAAKEG